MAIGARKKPVIQVARATELTREVAIKAAAAVEELNRASNMATMVARVATAVAQSAQLSDLTEAVLDQTVGVLGAFASSIYVADSEMRALQLVGSRGFPPEIVERVSTLSFDSDTAPSHVAKSLAIAEIEDLTELTDEPPILKDFLERIGVRRIIAIPLVAAEKLVGVLNYVLTNPDALSVDERAIIEVVASIVGVGFANALAQDRLERERARLATIFEYAPHGIIYMDLRERSMTGNLASERLLGQRTSGVPGPSPLRLFWPDGSVMSDLESAGVRAMRGETVSQQEILVERPDGSRRPVLTSATPVIGPRGSIDGVVIAFEDISVLKELDRLREEFAAIVAHDLRNPISAILMTAEMMAGNGTGDQLLVRTTAVERIRHSATRLGEMVKDLLDASRIEVGRLSLDRRPVDVVEAVKSVVSHIQPTLGEHPVEVDGEETHSCARLDPLRFEQMLTNLLENAAKYSAEGAPIVVRARERDGGVAISVIDAGIGIASDELPLLFDRFYQAKRARQMRKGLGLGLYITKGLVEAHEGRITVESTPGKGSTFEIWLPFTHSDAHLAAGLQEAK